MIWVKRRDRAILAKEFITLAKQSTETVARAEVLVEVENTPNVYPDEQFIQLIVLPNEPSNPAPIPTVELRQQVFEFLRPRRLITTRLRVIEPEYTTISIALGVLQDRRRLGVQVVKREIEQAIIGFLSPITGGEDGNGWELGRSLFRSELYQVIESVPGVDHVQSLLLNGDEAVSEIPLASKRSLINLSELNITIARN